MNVPDVQVIVMDARLLSPICTRIQGLVKFDLDSR